MKGISLDPAVLQEILTWAKRLEDDGRPESAGELELHLYGGYHQDEAFFTFKDRHYYALGKRFNGHMSLQIRHIETLQDLPVMLPEEIPAEIYDRLKDAR